MFALTDTQVKILKTVAQNVPVEKRGLLLERTAALMQFRPHSDESFREAVSLATVGLIQDGSLIQDGFVTVGPGTR
jgi:hypothetical protein